MSGIRATEATGAASAQADGHLSRPWTSKLGIQPWNDPRTRPFSCHTIFTRTEAIAHSEVIEAIVTFTSLEFLCASKFVEIKAPSEDSNLTQLMP